ncbi:nitric oxide reductase [Halolactibacillus alkaliphilus]|uniref:Nitric oxide reductase n=1 Tax=Halolactibacillus alkaliphilus TaxID=442899 RepID=A0A511WY02_9BACI|nr:prepilin-type N-terminal cleavage/methylation domain-containing protein [Halolactibacillus alkaliphilus]GEN55990.1 nitric oxide reductase [Halolactibacillus alkaliphilus]GGN68223.1 nitric oxide reductase [Halolactibacillus alkaliphilus]
MKNQKGFTLIEIILAMGIGFMLMAVIWSILGLGVRSQSFTANEYEKQANMRYAIETINNRMRFFTVGFAVTEDDFKPSFNDTSGKLEGVAAPWNYIGLSPGKTHLVHYEYKENGYIMTDLTLPVDGLTLDLRFIKESSPQNDNLLTLFLNGYENHQQTFDIKTTIEALNALHLVDWGDGTHSGAAVALAYRTEETPEIDKRPVAAMSMVLDTSGSMNWRVNEKVNGNDNTDNPDEKSRISILRDSLKLMVNDLSEGENAYVSFVPFHTNANIPNSNLEKSSPDNSHGFSVIKQDNLEEWRSLIDNIKANGGTNTGDGIRRGYYQLLNFSNELSTYELETTQEVKNYMIILVDGVTTMASAEVSRTSSWFVGTTYYYNNNYFLGKDNITENWSSNPLLNNSLPGRRLGPSTVGNGAELDAKGTDYVNMVGERLVRAKNLPHGTKDLELEDNVFVIGFSGITEDLLSLKDIAKAVGIAVQSDDSDIINDFMENDRVFVARSAEDLEGVFKNISGYIMEDLWQVSGPKLQP